MKLAYSALDFGVPMADCFRHDVDVTAELVSVSNSFEDEPDRNHYL